MQKPSEQRYSTNAIDNIGMDFISIECIEKLGLDQNPFIDHARDPFLFSDKQLEMSMNVLVDYLVNQNSTIVLLGEVGIGKTTHLRALLRKGYQQFNFCTLRAKPKISFAEIEQKIKERWRLPQNIDENELQADIDSNEHLATNEHIKKYIEDNKQPVLIIDDAHRLQNNVLDDLLKLKHHVGLQSPHTMGLILASEPALQTQLAELEQINPAATQIYQINVRSFDMNQCKEYIQYRMNKAGVNYETILNSEKISEIYTRSKGLPKHINKLAREEISKLCEKKTTATNTTYKLKSSPSMRLSLILAGLIGLAVIFAALTNRFSKPDETVSLDLSKPKTEQESIDTKDQAVATKPKNESNKKSNKEEIATKQKQASAVSKPSNKSIAKPYVAPLVLGPLLDSSPSTQTKSQNKQLKPTSSPKTVGKQAKTKNSTQSLHSSDWILEQDPKAYTIQIVASPNENNLQDFANKNSLKENTAYYKKSSADKNWFVLVHGIYSSREDALRGIETLSDSLKKNTPYPVQLKYLQEVIPVITIEQ